MRKIIIFILFLVYSIKLVSANIILNEVMYDPPCSDSYCEYIELYNNGENSINVSGWIIGDNNINDTLEGAFDNGEGTIIPGFSYSIITDQDSRVYNNYNVEDNIIWLYVNDDAIGNGLSNAETITLYDTNLNKIDQLSYDDTTNGKSLSLINGTWQESSPTPGKSNSNNETVLDYDVIKITEFLPDPEGNDDASMPGGEWVELYNSGNIALDLLGFELYDNTGSDPDIAISDTSTLSGTIIQPNSYLIIYSNGISGFLNNDNFEKIKLYDIYNNLLDEITYSDSDEGVSWSLSEEKWQKTVPTPNYANEDNKTSSKSEIIIGEIYDLGSDKKAEWGDIIRIKLFVSKGNTEKDVVWMWVENAEARITKKSKFNIYDKFQNYTFTYPLSLPENCNNEFLDGNYKVIVQGLDTTEEEILEIRGKPLCKISTTKTQVKNMEYGINSMPEDVKVGEKFTTEIFLRNNQKEDIDLDIWSYPYSGKKKFVKIEEKENKETLTLKSSEEKIIKLSNIINETEKEELNFKVKIQRLDRKTPYELTDTIKINKEIQLPNSSKTISEEKSKTLLNPITGFTVYESTGSKAKRSAIFFLNGVLALLLIFTLIKNGTSN